MSHGGLLPEEVIVPIVEWFGDEHVIPWPEVTFPDGAERDFDGWVLRALSTCPGSSIFAFRLIAAASSIIALGPHESPCGPPQKLEFAREAGRCKAGLGSCTSGG